MGPTPLASLAHTYPHEIKWEIEYTFHIQVPQQIPTTTEAPWFKETKYFTHGRHLM